MVPLFALLSLWLAPDGFYFPTAAIDEATARHYQRARSNLTVGARLTALPPDSGLLATTNGWMVSAGEAATRSLALPPGTTLQYLGFQRDSIPILVQYSIPIEHPTIGRGVIECIGTLSLQAALLREMPDIGDSVNWNLTPHFLLMPMRIESMYYTAVRSDFPPQKEL